MASGRPSLPALIEHCATAIVVATPRGRVALNGAACRLLGLPAVADVAELPAASLVSPAFAGSPTTAMAVQWRRATARIALRVSFAPVRQRGRVTRVIGVFEEVSEALRPGESVGAEVADAISHELRGPLTPILGWARLIQAKRPRDPELRQGAQVIERNVRLSLELLDEMLELSRLTTGATRPVIERVDLRAVCGSVLEDVGRALPGGVTLAHDDVAEPLWVKADAGQLRQAVRMLFAHAIRRAPPGGRLRITMEQRNGAVHLILSRAGAEGAKGVPDAGVSLGLAVARRLIELTGGQLSAEGGARHGDSELTIALPSYATPRAVTLEGGAA